ncbi:PilN domain-containing protein [Pseudomonas akapageensis]|uniref:PilN domain-containing protein n=1 Tax=Pseudomonas akapageensis TaxID=2609961 RepID=UPI001408A916|nr:PilN domain-containing protein [Pseudomonas akapageensis]
MVRINLLPWREQRREERRKRFWGAMAGVVLAAVAITLLINEYIGAAMDRQIGRNAYIQREIDQLDAQISQLGELRSQRQQLLERMQVIQGLQVNRSVNGHLFDQLVRTLPEGVYFSSVSKVGKTLSISGTAESNNRISELMRGLEASPWFAVPNLIEVKSAGTREVAQASTFKLTVRQSPSSAAGQAQ